MDISPSQLIKQLTVALKANLVPYIHGSPAVGKSAITQAVADKFKLKLIDIRLADYDPTDITGFPIIDPETGLARHVPFDTFPTENTPIPEGYKGWLVLFDEFSSAPRAVQAATYKVILDRMVGQYKLHKKCFLIAAGNREDDNAIVVPMSTALISRFCHFYLTPDLTEWKDWAASQGLDHRINAYLGFRPEHLYTFKPELTEAYASPRTWEMVSRVIQGETDISAFSETLAGLIGEGVSLEFKTFIKICSDIPPLEDILADPEGVPLKDDLSVKWALMGTVTYNITEDTQEATYKFLNRLSADLRVVAMREINLRHPQLRQTQAFQDWHTQVAMDAFG